MPGQFSSVLSTRCKQTFSARPDDEQSLAALIEMIRSEITRQRLNEGADEVTALVARASAGKCNPNFQSSTTVKKQEWKKSSEKESSSKTMVTCWFCGRKEHKRSECRSKKKAQKKQEAKVNFSSVYVTHGDQSSLGSSGKGSVQIVVDTGSTHHVFNDAEFFRDLKTLRTPREVRLGNSSTLVAQGEGTVSLDVQQGNRIVKLELKEALYVPRMNTNLISVSKLQEDKFELSFASKYKGNIAIAMGQDSAITRKQHGLCVITVIEPATVHQTLDLIGIPYIDDMDTCAACQQGKQHKQPSRAKPKECRAVAPGFIQADTCKATEPSMGGHTSFLCLTDDFTHYRKVYFLKTPKEVPNCI